MVTPGALKRLSKYIWDQVCNGNALCPDVYISNNMWHSIVKLEELQPPPAVYLWYDLTCDATRIVEFVSYHRSSDDNESFDVFLKVIGVNDFRTTAPRYSETYGDTWFLKRLI
jgi:hypothetical protein